MVTKYKKGGTNKTRKRKSATTSIENEEKRVSSKTGPKTVKGKRFALSGDYVPAGKVHDDVQKVQWYLGRYGYLSESYDGKCLDVPTQKALKAFQSYRKIPETGELDPPTIEALEQPRCGIPDVTPASRATSPIANFSLSGCDYASKFRVLTYAFVSGTSDLPGDAEKEPIRRAFKTWENVIPINFVEVGVANNPNFKIGWFTGDHGDDFPFTPSSNQIAHAGFPPPCGGTIAGGLHFDDAQSWRLEASTGVIDLESTALHEIGHLLGLKHSDNQDDVMFGVSKGEARVLQPDDIAGIQNIYGRREFTFNILVHLQDIGDVRFRENEFAGTRGQSRRLEAFQIDFNLRDAVNPPSIRNLSMRYMAHLEGIGDVPFEFSGSRVGTRGQSRRLEGFAIELVGPNASNFNVVYMAHLQDTGDTGFFKNGEFCGTRGLSRRVEGMLVRVDRK